MAHGRALDELEIGEGRWDEAEWAWRRDEAHARLIMLQTEYGRRYPSTGDLVPISAFILAALTDATNRLADVGDA